MGREIRMVPPNWEHPRHTQETDPSGGLKIGQYHPMFDRDFRNFAAEWNRSTILWSQGKHPDQLDETYSVDEYEFYWEWVGDPPDRAYYRPEFKEEPTWFQAYETVSEGTPVSPPFATREELAQYLHENGDFWWQRRDAEGYEHNGPRPTLEEAQDFVNGAYTPTMIISSDGITENGVKQSGEI